MNISVYSDSDLPAVGSRVFWRGAAGEVEQVWPKGEHYLFNMDYATLDPEDLEDVPEDELYLPSASAMARVWFAGGRVEVRPVHHFSR